MKALLWVAVVAACGGDKPPAPAGPTNTAPVTLEPKSKASACDTLVIAVEPGGTWIGAPPDVICYKPHVSGAPNTAWIEGELTALKAKLGEASCAPAVEIGADGVTYQQVVLVMDVAIKVGLVDVGLSDPGSLAMTLPPMMGGLPAQHCDGKLDTTHRAKPDQGKPAAPANRDALQTAPVLIVTTSELKLGDKVLGDVANAAKGSGKLPELATALAELPAKGLLILQADQSTPATLINRIVVTAKGAGFDNLLFAVKNK